MVRGYSFAIFYTCPFLYLSAPLMTCIDVTALTREIWKYQNRSVESSTLLQTSLFEHTLSKSSSSLCPTILLPPNLVHHSLAERALLLSFVLFTAFTLICSNSAPHRWLRRNSPAQDGLGSVMLSSLGVCILKTRTSHILRYFGHTNRFQRRS